jgi:DNA-binding NarL/FixJ family response regulator
MKIQIGIVDDNYFLIQALKEKLSFFEEFEVYFTAKEGEHCLKRLEKKSDVDLILMDIEMPKMNGIEATRALKQKYPQIKVVMLTVLDDHDSIFEAIQAGADGYLLKEIEAADLQKSLQEVMEGGAPMSPSIAKKALQLLRNPQSIQKQEEREEVQLSKREVEVLTQLSHGLSYMQIAENLIRSPKTIRNHIERIYKKLQVHSKIEAVQKARNNYLI